MGGGGSLQLSYSTRALGEMPFCDFHIVFWLLELFIAGDPTVRPAIPKVARLSSYVMLKPDFKALKGLLGGKAPIRPAGEWGIPATVDE